MEDDRQHNKNSHTWFRVLLQVATADAASQHMVVGPVPYIRRYVGPDASAYGLRQAVVRARQPDVPRVRADVRFRMSARSRAFWATRRRIAWLTPDDLRYKVESEELFSLIPHAQENEPEEWKAC